MLQFPGELELPSIARVHRRVNNSCVIRRQLDVSFVERADAATSERRDEEAQLKDDVLPRPRFQQFGVVRSPADIIGRKQDDREPDGGVRLELLDDRASAIRLLVKNDRLEAEVLQ